MSLTLPLPAHHPNRIETKEREIVALHDFLVKAKRPGHLFKAEEVLEKVDPANRFNVTPGILTKDTLKLFVSSGYLELVSDFNYYKPTKKFHKEVKAIKAKEPVVSLESNQLLSPEEKVKAYMARWPNVMQGIFKQLVRGAKAKVIFATYRLVEEQPKTNYNRIMALMVEAGYLKKYPTPVEREGDYYPNFDGYYPLPKIRTLDPIFRKMPDFEFCDTRQEVFALAGCMSRRNNLLELFKAVTALGPADQWLPFKSIVKGQTITEQRLSRGILLSFSRSKLFSVENDRNNALNLKYRKELKDAIRLAERLIRKAA